MVAIITGKGTGLERSSAWVLGSRGQLGSATMGRDGESLYVNAATGNLVITRRDEFLIGQGPDVVIDRTYNSQSVAGIPDGDNNDNWRIGAYRKVTGLSGSYGGAGTTVKRIDWDGSDTLYSWNATENAYVATDGTGAYDKLTRSGTTWTWTDGNSQITESYDDSNGGRVLLGTDTDGNTVNYTYDATTGLLTWITNTNGADPDGFTKLVYGTGTTQTQLQSIETRAPGSGGLPTLTRIYYEYDGYGRLAVVKVNLDATDNSKSNGANYVTTYTYVDTASTRIASISQTDGSYIAFTYVLVGADYRVASYTQTVAAGVTRTTSFDYSVAGRTIVTDPAGQKTILWYNSNNELTQISYPPDNANTTPRVVQFAYNANGDVTSATLGPGNVVAYEYDGHGNLTRERDSAGNTVARTYSAKNELLTETRYLVPDPDGSGSGQPGTAVTTRYAYDSESHLRYVVSAEGFVTQYEYDALGRQTAANEYVANAYNIAGLAENVSVAEGTLTTWVGGLDKTGSRRTETAYDYRGNVTTITSYSKLLSNGLFDTSSELSQTNYVYDQAGNLLSRQVTGAAAGEVFTYDGLGRTLTATDAVGAVTRTSFLDATGQTVLTHANGLSEISTYNKAGELIAFSKSRAGGNLVDLTGWPSNAASMPAGQATVPGWINPTGYTDETQWALTNGPDGIPVVAMRAGQLDASQEGGGNLTNEVLIDASKAYEFTYYFKLSDLGKHNIYFGLSGISPAMVENLDGTDNTNPYFLAMGTAEQNATLTADRWYKVVGYVLPQGAPDPGISPSGLYDTVTGQRIAAISTFRWNPERAAQTVHARFFDYYGEANQQYSTYFYQPEIRQVTTASVGGNLIDLTGWPGNPASIPGGQATVPGWMNPVGYTDETQWAATTGPNGAQVVAMRAGQLDASQEGGGNYTHEIAIDGTKAYEFTYYFKLSDLNKHGIYFGLSEGAPAMVETLDGTDNSNPYFFTRWITDQSGTFTADKWYKVVAYVLPQGTANPGALGGVYDTATGQKVLDVTNFRWNPERTGTTVHARFFDYYGEANQQYSTYFYKPEIRQVSTATVLGPDTATSLYRYDNLGRLRMTVDPTGRRNYMMYDSVGRKVADIDSDGSVLEYRYDGNDNLTSTTRYANKLSGGQLASLVDSNGNPTSATLASLRPAAHADDQWTFQVYDLAQRLVQTIDGTGATSVFAYDGASRLTATTQYANRLDSATLTSLKAVANNQNRWNLDANGAPLYRYNLSVAGAGTIDGANANQLTVGAATDWQAFYSDGISVSPGQTVSATITVEAVGSLTTDYLGLYGGTGGWGADSDSYATIVSGPGQLTYQYGGLFFISGLSTTEATRFTVTRTYHLSEWASPYFYLGNGSVVQGWSTIISAPVYASAPSSPILPTADAANDRVSRSFYDNDGRLIAAMDAAGGLTQFTYDKAGRKVLEFGFAKAVTQSLRATGTLSQMLSSLSQSASDRATAYTYDSRGYLRYTIDASGHPTGYTYDGAGRVIRTTDYAGWIAGAASYPLSYVESQLASTGLNTSSYNRISRSLYDAAGRLMFAIEATGAVSAFGYDNVGRVIKQTRYATPYTAAGDPSMATMQSWCSDQAAHAYNRIDRTIYDLSGRVVFTVDAEGYVTEHQYDKAGRAARDIRYAAVYSVSDGVTRESLAAQVATAGVSAKVTVAYAYDADGRLGDVTRDLTDSLVTVTHTVYDALGQATDVTVAYGTADASTTRYTYDAAGRVLTETRGFGSGVAATTTNTYDAVGNLLTTRFGDWTTRMTYDAVGRVLTVTVPVDTNSANDLVTTNEYDAFGRLVRVEDAKLVSKFLYYNSLGQMTLEVDRERYATQTYYTVFGEVAQVVRRAARTTGTPTVTTPPTIVTGAGDATTTFAYDKLSRLICVADAEGFQESYYFNAFGNRLHLFNKTGGHSEYVYDRLGRMSYEYVYQKAYRADGSVQQDGYYKTQLSYDSRGNIVRKTEALSLTEQRQTDYVYDKANRLVTVVNPLTATVGADLVTVTYTYPQESYAYNLRGDRIRSVDGAGGTTFTYYDALGRKTDEVSPVGTLSHWSYDGNGNLQTARVYGDPVALPTGPAYALPSPANANNYRQTVYGYDGAHRLITTTVAGLTSGAFVGSSYSTTYSGDVVTQAYYDKNGNVWAAVDGAGNVTWTWYDALNRKVAQVDAENYLTCWTLDANGNAAPVDSIPAEIRYATRITGSFNQNSTVAQLKALAGTSAADRITNFTYDRNGRRLTETRLGVVAWTVDINGILAAASSTSATITYTYNGLGQVLTKTEANGDLTQYQYDALGRLEKTTGAAFVDFMGTYLRPVTNLRYDGLGNLVRTVATGDSTTYTPDRVTTNAYDAGGRLAATTDANGVVRSYAYDAAGRVVKESWSRLKSDGTTSVTEAIGYRYDLAGRLVTQAAATQSGSAFVFGDATRIQYNAYGEMSGRGLTAGPDSAAVYQETFFYDAGGRLFKSTGGDGTIKFLFYDKAGRATLSLTSAGADLSSTTFGDAFGSLTSAGGTTIANAVTTVTVYDKRGLATQIREPGRVLTAGGSATALITTRDYNAFGEQVNEIDPRGWLAGANPDSFKTEYGYNTLGRMIEKKSPSVSWTSESGAVSSARPTEYYYYDISGRLVGIDDANGRRTTRQLVAGTGHEGAEALVHSERHADDGILTNWHNVFGDARVLVNELGAVEVRGYDNMGRVTEVDHRGGLLNDYYVYDSLGRQTRHWNNFLGSSNVERTDYDVQGRVVSQIAFGGDVTTSTYGWYDTFGTTGLGQFGGWQKVTTFANGGTIYENTDYFGRLTWRNDMGYHVFAYGFDKAGRTTSQTVGGETLTFSYFNTGLTASISNGAGNGTNYGYDAAGNEISEWTQKNYVVVQNATAAFDALNRMTSWAEAGNGTLNSGSPPASMAWEYDLAGNIRRSSGSYRSLDAQGVANGAAFTHDNWYRYDNMNRVTVEKGVLSGGQIVGGIIYGYDAAGRRATVTQTISRSKPLSKYIPSLGNHTPRYYDEHANIIVPDDGGGTWSNVNWTFSATEVETYGYTADGYLSTVSIAVQDLAATGDFGTTNPHADTIGASQLRSSHSYDAMGRETRQIDWIGNGTDAAYDRTVTYNAKGQVATENTISKQIEAGATTASLFGNDTTNYYGSGSGYDLGSIEHSVTTNKKDNVVKATVTTTNTYSWWDGPAQATINIFTDNVSGADTNYTTTNSYTAAGKLASASIADGRARTVTFVTNMAGEIIRRDEADGNTTNGDPHEIWYRYGGRQLGFDGNNGTLDTDYLTSIDNRQRTPPTNPNAFLFGSASAVSYADFSQALNPVNSYAQGSDAGSYTVRAGDTLQSIAQNLWGDSSLWYLLASANGLSSPGSPGEGRTLAIPANAMSNAHNASTFRPYDPAKAIGDISPTNPKPTKKPGGCGVVGMILMVVIAVAVSAITYGALTGPSTTFLGAMLAGAASGVAGSVASQAFGLATGMQSKFDWKGVAIGAISGAIGGGLGSLKGAAGAFLNADKLVSNVAKGVLSSALSQGVGVATGLQKKFDWMGVATAGIAAGAVGIASRTLAAHGLGVAPGQVNSSTPHNAAFYANQALSGMAGALASAGARTIVQGSDFGDNILAALPDVIGSTIGNMIADPIVAGIEQARMSGYLDGEVAVFGEPVQPGQATDQPEITVTGQRTRVSEADLATWAASRDEGGVAGLRLDRDDRIERREEILRHGHLSSMDQRVIASLDAQIAALQGRINNLDRIHRELVRDGIGRTVTVDGQPYQIKGPSIDGRTVVFATRREAALDGIALSYYVSSVTHDPFERGAPLDLVTGGYTYRDLTVGTTPSTDRSYTRRDSNGQIVRDRQGRAIRAPAEKNVPFLLLPFTRASRGFFHIHPRSTSSEQYGIGVHQVTHNNSNQNFSDGDVDTFRRAGLYEWESYLGGSDGSFRVLHWVERNHRQRLVNDRIGPDNRPYFEATNTLPIS